ncbi:MAG: flagellar biosynthesis protein FlhF [Nitrospirota bacterium]
MQIKKFEAVDMQEAIKMVKSELGSDAIILSTKKIKKGGGTFGLFSRPLIEVTAANDYDLSRNRTHHNNNSIEEENKLFSNDLQQDKRYITNEINKEHFDLIVPLHDELSVIKNGIEFLTQSYSAAYKESGGIDFKDELMEIKSIMKRLVRQTSNNAVSSFHENLLDIYKRLIANNLSEDITLKIVDFMNQRLSQDDKANKDYVETYLSNLLMNRIKVSGPILKDHNEHKIAIFVGPTGVGKTTTIAKLAAKYALSKKDSVSLVTLDTYRIAAIEQLKIYSKILGITVDVVVTMKDLRELISKKRQSNLILIDTAGRSQKDNMQMTELKKFIGRDISFEVNLVMSATTKESDLKDIVQRFNIIPIDKLLFTKLDETTSFGSIFNIMFQTGKPLSYFTTGQKVPEDIEVVSTRRVVDLMLGRVGELRS